MQRIRRRSRICSIWSRSARSRILVPLDRNNRVLVHQGLRRIRAGRCVAGIRALLEAANCIPANIVAADLGFQIGPRLNAAGRLDDMSIGIQCLLTDDPDAARLLAARLTQLNTDRKELELQMQQEALLAIADMRAEDPQLPLGLCLFDESWHQGVVGLVASRVKERVNRPVIALARADANTLKGSARSIAGVHIRDVLDAVATRHPGLIEKFGGHAMAAGLTLARGRPGKIPQRVRCRSASLDERRGHHRRGAFRRQLAAGRADASTSRGCCSRPGRGVSRFPNRCSMAASKCAMCACSASGT